MTNLLKQRIIGLCILAAFPLFGGGQSMLGTELHGLGLLMCLINSLAVISAGFLMRSVMATSAPLSGDIYFAARITEGLFLGLSVLGVQGSLLGLTITNDTLYQIAMTALGLGSLPMCRWLIGSNFVPKWLGTLGFAGYLCLVVAMGAAAYGFETASMALLLPGAVFEVTFGLILALRGRKYVLQSR
jgi:hypothetical protein